MRVPFQAPSEYEFYKILGGFAGGGLGDIRSVHFNEYRGHQRGAGIFASLASLARKAIPFIIKNVGPSASQFTRDVLSDVATGNQSIKTSLRNRGISALKDVGTRILKGGKKRKRRVRDTGKRNNKKRKKSTSCTKKKKKSIKKDIFSLI